MTAFATAATAAATISATALAAPRPKTTAKTDTSEYLPALHSSINRALEAPESAKVYALKDRFFDYPQKDVPVTEGCGALAICNPVVGEEDWFAIQAGDFVLFTHLAEASNDQPAKLTTYCGTMAVYDEGRGLLYFEDMMEDYSMRGFSTSELREMHTVERFIELPALAE